MPPTLLPGVIAEFAFRGRPVRFFVRNLADSIQGEHARGAFYEAEELEIIERRLTPGGTFLDIGANVGNHAVFAARFGGQAQVIVVEPNPEAVEILKLNLLLNDLDLDTGLLGLGFSDRELTVEPATPRNNLGGARMLPNPAGGLRLVPGDSRLEGRHIDFIKIDVEGQELAVLAGLERTIAATRPVIFAEVDDAHRAAFDAWAEAHAYQAVETFRRYETNENVLLVPQAGSSSR